ncbi:MAG: hypothetical protein IT373_00870 [Polyangiaceae bacterium]|nr:hypothetical protein [Polyangiaceae bacterium]
MKNRVVGRVATVVLVAASLGGCGGDTKGAGTGSATGSATGTAATPGTTASAEPKKAETVLGRIESFKANVDKGSPEPYDGIKLANEAKATGLDTPVAAGARELPPTLTDALLYDFRLVAFLDLKLPKFDKTVTEEQMQQVVDFFAKTEWKKLRGLRPQTHKQFIDGLSEADRKQLAKEATAWAHANGFKGDDPLAGK